MNNQMLWFAYLKGRLSNFHFKGSRPDIFIISTARSGSTFLMELLYAQKGVKIFDEPLNVNYPVVRRELQCKTWEEATLLLEREKVYGNYFERLRNNKIPELNIPFYRKFNRFFTNRNVFKVLHGAEDMAKWLQKKFHADILILIRHPIPTALSHKQFQRLPFLLENIEFRRTFNSGLIKYAENLIRTGTHFEKGVLNWCLQNYPIFVNNLDPSWAVVNYEDLTMYPQDTFNYMKRQLHLDNIQNIDTIANKPSGSTIQSEGETKHFFDKMNQKTDKTFLITKWRKKISPEEEKRAFEILHNFNIDFYEIGNDFPSEQYRISTLSKQLKP